MYMGPKKYIQVICPVKLAWNPWYYTEDEVSVGSRVRVQLGKCEYVAVVYKVTDRPDIDPSKIKPVNQGITGLPAILPEQIKLWEFIADYYLCTIGEVYKCAYPHLKIKDEEIGVRKAEKALKKAGEGTQAKLGLSFSNDSRQSLPKLVVGTERMGVYMSEARRVLNSGMSVLVLVPEIEIGENLEQSLRGEFQDRLMIFNSMKTLPQRRKVEQALRALENPVVILATRSSLFLPYQDLGLVIVDEEQDPNFKQQDPAPRYNARDAAIMLAHIHGAQVLLGSACPSMESLHNTECGKYELIRTAVRRPEIEVVDIPAEKRKRGMKGDYSIKALEALRDADGLVTVVRGYKTEEETAAELADLLPGMDPQVISAYAARKNIVRSKLTVVLQADLLFPRDDFRADEKALQMLTLLAARTERLIVQTAKAVHPMFKALCEGTDLCYELLDERRQFGMPPFSRLVRIKTRYGVPEEEVTLLKDNSLKLNKQQIEDKYLNTNLIIDVDPL